MGRVFPSSSHFNVINKKQSNCFKKHDKKFFFFFLFSPPLDSARVNSGTTKIYKQPFFFVQFSYLSSYLSIFLLGVFLIFHFLLTRSLGYTVFPTLDYIYAIDLNVYCIKNTYLMNSKFM